MIIGKNGEHIAATWDELGVIIPYGKTGQFKTKCPVCKDSRKEKNRNDTPLSVDLREGVGN
jgi:hypothetical protein